MREIMLNLSAWIERRADNLKPYAGHIIHSVKAYEAEIERLRRPEAAQVRVKALTWSTLGADPACIAQQFPYQIWPNNGGSGAPDDPFIKFNNFRVFEPFMMNCVGDEYETLDEAKAAAQADYERRIRAALEPDLLSTTGAEQRWIEDMEMACDYCGGSGHKDDIKQPDTVTDDLSKSIADFVSRQEPLGAEFEQVLADNIEELYEAQPDTAADTATGWQDISTAPNRTDVLLYQDGWAINPVIVGRRHGDVWLSDCFEINDPDQRPTHWRPLPPAPEKEG